MPSSAATQYMIDKFKLTKIVVAGTCAGISTDYKALDIFAPNKAVQYDTTVKEKEPLLRERFIVDLDIERYNLDLPNGIIGTADKAVVMWKDYLELKRNHITIADTESGAVAYVCKLNNIECIILKGISDFPKKDIDDEVKGKKAYDKQYNTFVKNIPIIMHKIYADYIHKIL